MRKSLFVIVVVLVVLAIVWLLRPASPDEPTAAATQVGQAIVDVVIPSDLSENAIIGKRVFDARCSSCHGDNGAGRNGMGPPLVHKIYEPSHHGDEAFQRAAANGVRSHHWPFGDMPAQDGVTRADVAAIVVYIRSLQRENGIN